MPEAMLQKGPNNLRTSSVPRRPMFLSGLITTRSGEGVNVCNSSFNTSIQSVSGNGSEVTTELISAMSLSQPLNCHFQQCTEVAPLSGYLKKRSKSGRIIWFYAGLFYNSAAPEAD